MSAERNSAEDAMRIFEESLIAPEEADDRFDTTRLLRELDRGRLLGGWPADDDGELRRVASTLRLSGRYAVPAPLAETALARWLLSSSGLPVADGWLAVAPIQPGDIVEFQREGGGWRLSGGLRGIPFAYEAARLVVAGRTREGEDMVAVMEPTALALSPGEGLSGETRDDARLEGVFVAKDDVAPGGAAKSLPLAGALARALQMAGAMERVLDLSIAHARKREQFGRPIGKFQAIQHHLAVMAGEVAAASAAADSAVLALGSSENVEGAAFEVAAAKVRAGEASGEVAEISHQVHGAIGFTERHPLRHFTRRLWTWRDEFGSEEEWSSRLGEYISMNGADGLWPALTRKHMAPDKSETKRRAHWLTSSTT